MPVPCVFCERLEAGPLTATSEHAAAFVDAFPASPGHTLVVARRHEPDFFALVPEEQAAVWRLTAVVVGDLTRAHRPDGFNVGLNAGAAAGQTVMHAHVHVIPRYAGDIDDPRGGVRWVQPGQADYWSRR